MNKYIGKICPYCKSTFTEDDEIVVCSDCEMPHHKECWVDNKGCTTFGCQGTIQGIDFDIDTEISSAPKYEVRDAEAQQEQVLPAFCSKCGSPLTPGMAFCSKCGAQVMMVQSVIPQESYAQKISEVTSKVSSEIKNVMDEYKTNDYLDQELGTYIGTKKEYYLKEFATLKSQKKYNSWNTFAFLIAPYWCMYRKMYIAGAVILGINFLLSVIGGALSEIMGIAIAVLVGIFANYFYMYDLEQRIAKGKNLIEPQKSVYISQKGDTNATIPAVVAVIYTLICVILFV